MFDVGFWELILVFGLGLMILGPERLPRVAAQVGRWVSQARRTANQLRRQLEMEIRLDEPPTHNRPKPPPASSTPASAEVDAAADDKGFHHGVEDEVEEEVEAVEEAEVEADLEIPNSPDTHGKD